MVSQRMPTSSAGLTFLVRKSNRPSQTAGLLQARTWHTETWGFASSGNYVRKHIDEESNVSKLSDWFEIA
jgi:hypothetical protein